jgi:hypothetical protein
MKKIVKTIVQVTYQCKRCRRTYTNKKDALECERWGVEKRPFKVGDRVRATQGRTHWCGCPYVCEGRIKKIVGPLPFTIEVVVSYGTSQDGKGHYYLYEISSGRCPKCKERRSAQYPSRVLKPAPKR